MKPKFIKKAGDLVTKSDATKAGFLQQAVTKGAAAAPYIARAREFSKALEKVRGVDSLLEDLPDFRAEFIAAAGISEKGAGHLSNDDLEKVIKEALKTVSTEKDFRKELIDRYLLTKGDSLGGSMRNRIGSSAGERLVESLLQELAKRQIKAKIVKSKSEKVTSIEWDDRLLRFDHKPRLIGKNIDAILVSTEKVSEITDEIFNDPSKYLAAGELKGGIDPAGADEHWKTANSALDRIRTCFASTKSKPALFFVGAAIEGAMAKEIFDQLQDERLTYAANLTSEEQLRDLATWLTSL